MTTIVRVLAELKTIDARIKKALENACFITTKMKDKPANGNIEMGVRKYQSVVDLMKRQKKLKSALLKSNSVTTVTIGHEEMTVAEAIAMKALIPGDEALLETLKWQLVDVKSTIEKHEVRTDAGLEKLLQTQFSNSDSDPSCIKTITDAYSANNSIEIVDPLNLEIVIEELEEYIFNFKETVDIVLTESNAITTVFV